MYETFSSPSTRCRLTPNCLLPTFWTRGPEKAKEFRKLRHEFRNLVPWPCPRVMDPSKHTPAWGWMSKITHRMGWSNSIGILTIFFFEGKVEMLVLRGFQVDGQCSIRNGWGFQTGVFLKKCWASSQLWTLIFVQETFVFWQYQKKQDNWYGCFQKWGTPKWMVYDGKPY